MFYHLWMKIKFKKEHSPCPTKMYARIITIERTVYLVMLDGLIILVYIII